MYESISGLCTNRLKFGFESTEFGYETNGQKTTVSTKRPDTNIISLRAGLQLGVERNTNMERTSAIHQTRKETGDKLVEMVDLMAVLGLLPVPLCSHFHSFIYLFALFFISAFITNLKRENAYQFSCLSIFAIRGRHTKINERNQHV